jgi:hypothetical protein
VEGGLDLWVGNSELCHVRVVEQRAVFCPKRAITATFVAKATFQS